MDLLTFLYNAREQSRLLNAFLANFPLPTSAIVDHLCFKCISETGYEHLRGELESSEHSKYIFQSYISGRRIAVISLVKPIEWAGGGVRILELCDQKPDCSQTHGFDHFEIIFPDETSMTQYLATCGVETVAGQVTYKVPIPDQTLVLRCTTEPPLIERIRANEFH